MRPIRYTASGAITGSWLPVDDYVAAGVYIGFFVTASGGPTGTASIEVTADDVFNTAIVPVAFAADAANLVAFTGNQRGVQTTPIKAARINTSLSGTGAVWIFTIIQQGAR